MPVFVIAVNALGHVCWETALTRPTAGSHSYSQPLVSDGKAILDADGDVFAVSLGDGIVRWRWKSGSPVTNGSDFGGNQLVAVADGIVVATKVSGSQRYLVGLNDQSGAIAWQTPEPARFTGGPYDTGQGSVVFTANTGAAIEAIDDRTGAKMWSQPQPPSPSGPVGVPIPVNSVFAPAAGVLVLGSPTGGLDALNPSTGKVQWHYGGSVSQITVAAGLLLVTPHPGSGSTGYDVPVTALDPTTGRTLWSSAPVDPGGSIFTATSSTLMHIEFGPQGGTLSRIDPSNGQVVWRVPTEPYAAAGAGGVMTDVESTGYQNGAGAIVGRNPTTGAPEWTTPVGGENLIHASLFTLNGSAGPVVVLKNGSDFAGYDPSTGRRIWDVGAPPDALVDGTVATSNGLIIQMSGSQYAIQGH